MSLKDDPFLLIKEQQWQALTKYLTELERSTKAKDCIFHQYFFSCKTII
jgi:hypothetical protein